jgi:hypothetical protein
MGCEDADKAEAVATWLEDEVTGAKPGVERALEPGKTTAEDERNALPARRVAATLLCLSAIIFSFQNVVLNLKKTSTM